MGFCSGPCASTDCRHMRVKMRDMSFFIIFLQYCYRMERFGTEWLPKNYTSLGPSIDNKTRRHDQLLPIKLGY